jgi:class 3 adenylate cyclase/tetratricopeptide (TPR) repeat protein
MKCSRCQQEAPSDAEFCPECGTKLAAVCAQCGTANASGHKFCKKCGHPLASAAGARPAGERFGSPETYTPKHLAEKILTSKAALEGERKQVTVLFADLKGSMELLADRDPEEARRILDPVLERMMEAVHRYEGTVNQVLGDGIMALFGAPLAHEDHAVRGCYAALRMQDALKHYAGEVHRTEGVPIQIRVGLNSGEVVVRSIGSDLRMDYTAVGQTTHLAARMEQLAMPGSILITPETLALAEGYVVVKSLGPRPIRGLHAAVEVYEIVGAATVRSRFQAAASRGLTRFVGREADLHQLHQALGQARAGRGQVVAVVGEPGIGKSRLYWEFTRSHRTQGWLTIEAGSVSYGKATNYLPVVELLRAYFQIEAGDGVRKITEKVTGKLLSLDRSLEAVIPPLLWLLDVPIDDESWARLDAGQRRRQTLDGVKRLLLRESQAQPLIVVFEDLHWIDAETQALLDSLVESLPTARMLLLVNYRPEYQHAWSSKTYYRLLRIDPLPQVSSEELLEALLGADASLRPLKDLLIARTEGNPFFLEESVRTLVETKILAGERGAYRLTKMPDLFDRTLQIPATARALLAARIDRLSPEDKRLLQAASVIGTDVPFDLLQAIMDEDETELRGGLARLQAAEFLYETRLFPELEYTFKHALTHEVTYGSLLHERRRALHARIVGAIERLYPDRLTEQTERLAHHAVRGELKEKAVTYLHQAGAKAFARSAHREAAGYFEQALTIVSSLPAMGDMLDRAIDLRVDLRGALFPLGEIERGLAYLREAERLARELDDPRRLGWISAYMSNQLWMTRASTEGLALGERALAIAERVADRQLQLVATYYVGCDCMTRGDYRRTEELFRRVATWVEDNVLERCGMTGFPAGICRAYVAWSLAERGEFAQAIAVGQEGVGIAERIDHPFTLTWSCWGLANSHLIRGELNHALALLERGLGIARDWNLRVWSPFLPWGLGRAYVLSGRVMEGLALIEESLRARDSLGIQTWHPLVLVHLGEAYLRADRLADACTSAQRAVTLACERAERGHEAYALRLLGEITALSSPGDVETAAAHYRNASTLATELGMRPLVAHCHLGLGRLYRLTGAGVKGQEHLTTATTMYRVMDMPFWLEQAEAEMKGLA